MSIADTLNLINDKISTAAMKSGRKKEDITLIAVSKMQDIEKMKEAKAAGVTVFGENKVQELTSKYPYIDDVRWHLIGSLQRNKVKYIIDKVDLIHSVDSIELAREIDKRANNANKNISILLQVNIGKEGTKSGIYEEEIEKFLMNIDDLKYITVKGLMAIPPKVDNSIDARIYFRKMKELFERNKKTKTHNINFEFLSMGMSNDYEVAIEEGANIVRIGTLLFGERINLL